MILKKHVWGWVIVGLLVWAWAAPVHADLFTCNGVTVEYPTQVGKWTAKFTCTGGKMVGDTNATLGIAEVTGSSINCWLNYRDGNESLANRITYNITQGWCFLAAAHVQVRSILVNSSEPTPVTFTKSNAGFPSSPGYVKFTAK